MDIQGKIIEILPLQSGVSKAGKEWKKQSVLLEQNVDFNKMVMINAFGEKQVNSLNKFSVGDTIDVSVNVYSNEFNGKYYTSLDGWWWANKNAKVTQEEHTGIPAVDRVIEKVVEDDLPF